MYHPECQVLEPDAPVPEEAALTPIYPSTEGLHQASWRSLTEEALRHLGTNTLRELLPAGLMRTAVRWQRHYVTCTGHRPTRPWPSCWPEPTPTSNASLPRNCWRTTWDCC